MNEDGSPKTFGESMIELMEAVENLVITGVKCGVMIVDAMVSDKKDEKEKTDNK